MNLQKSQPTVLAFTLEAVRTKLADRHSNTAKGYGTLLQHLRSFSKMHFPCGGSKAGFDKWGQAELISFRNYLSVRGCCSNTIQLYLRRLHALHCRAAERKQAKIPGNLYQCVFEKEERTHHQPLSVRSLCLIRDAVFTGKQASLKYTCQLFTLSFYLRGIPFVDLAHLRHNDLRDGRLYYGRSKTGRRLVVVLNKDMLRLINRLKTKKEESFYLLPIIKRPGADDEDQQYESALRCYNKQLQRVRELLHIDEKLSSYTPRYSWANLAMERGVSLSYVSAALGHASKKTTLHYVNSFTPELLAQANEWVLKAMKQLDPKSNKRSRKQQKNPRQVFGGWQESV